MRKYIEAEVLKNNIHKCTWVHDTKCVEKFVDRLPAADVQEVVKEWCYERNCVIVAREDFPRLLEVRHGRWEEHIINNIYCEGGVAFRLTCPVCGECFTVTREARPRERFCRWCGAKMDACEVVSETGTPPEWGDRSWAFKGGAKMDEVSE